MPWKQIEPMNQRTEFVLRAIKTENFRALCQEFGISAKTGYKWRERFFAHGLEGLEEHSRKPKTSPSGLGGRCEPLSVRDEFSRFLLDWICALCRTPPARV
jgi:transposase-like protein